MKFTSAQQEAIEHRGGHLQIIACAGSGKTQVLVARIVGLLQEGVLPKNIIAFTFTDKAATELKERVRFAVGEAKLPMTGLVEMYIGTIHGWCLNFLQSSLNTYLKFRVMNEPQTKLMIKQYSKKSGLTETKHLDGSMLKAHIHDIRRYQQMLNILREDDIDYAHVPDHLLESLDKYRELLHQLTVFDYSELLRIVVDGLQGKNPEWVKAKQDLHERLQYLLVDEYQDINPIQEQLIQLMSEGGAHISVVGDDDQTIYAWRGSDVSNILTFTDRFDSVHTVEVTTNFRSTPEIVETGRRIAELNSNRLHKTFHAGSHHRHEDGDIMALKFASAEQEAAFVAQRIEDYHGMPYQDRIGQAERGLDWGDMAILLRSVRNDAGPLIEALRERGIPFIVKGVQQLFEQPEIIACKRTFDYIIGNESKLVLHHTWLQAGLGVDETLLENAIDTLPLILEGKDELWDYHSIQAFFLQWLKQLQLTEESIPDPSNNNAGALKYFNLGMFSQLISDYEAINFKFTPSSKYKQFVSWLEYYAPDLYDEGGLEHASFQPNAVQILTIHQAKGLQWPCVFVPCLQRNRFPARKVGGKTIWHLLPKEAVRNQERYENSIEDERRLFYVAVTRAERFLTCTFAPSETRDKKHPSQFMSEIMYGGAALSDEPYREWLEPIDPTPRIQEPVVSLSFSEWKYWSECAYLYKLRFHYGFDSPIVHALGYGKSLHDALAEAHRNAISGHTPTSDDIPMLLENHLNLPYAFPDMHDRLEAAARRALERYFERHGRNLEDAIHSEKDIEFSPAPGVIVHGRIDLVTERETNVIRLVDFKSTERAQVEDVSMDQLMIYAAGFEELDGRLPDYIEVINLDENGTAKRDKVEAHRVEGVVQQLKKAGDQIRTNQLKRIERTSPKCQTCDLRFIC